MFLALVGNVKSVLKFIVFDITHPAVALFVLAQLRTNLALSVLIVTNAATAANEHSMVAKLRSHERVQVIIVHKTMHCKDLIVDDEYLKTGSANLTERGSASNFESMIALRK